MRGVAQPAPLVGDVAQAVSAALLVAVGPETDAQIGQMKNSHRTEQQVDRPNPQNLRPVRVTATTPATPRRPSAITVVALLLFLLLRLLTPGAGARQNAGVEDPRQF